jgi:uncharacterized protein
MDMEQLKKDMLGKKVWAVIGVTPNKEKFGYKIYDKLKNRGYEVYGINPKYDEIDGDKCYSSVGDLPKTPSCISMVVPPKVTKSNLEDVAQANIKNVWFQPGTFNDEVIEEAKSKELNIVYNDCVLVALG